MQRESFSRQKLSPRVNHLVLDLTFQFKEKGLRIRELNIWTLAVEHLFGQFLIKYGPYSGGDEYWVEHSFQTITH